MRVTYLRDQQGTICGARVTLNPIDRLNVEARRVPAIVYPGGICLHRDRDGYRIDGPVFYDTERTIRAAVARYRAELRRARRERPISEYRAARALAQMEAR